MIKLLKIGLIPYFLGIVTFVVPLTSTLASDPLSEVHKHLDKTSKCGSCHGNDINVADSSKCRDCHKDIDRRIRKAKGYHGRLRGDINCSMCHQEHMGRKYQIVRLDTRRFDHDQTGWPLVGKHAQTSCRQCHTNKRKSGRQSYLGTSPECVQCHGQFHGKGIAANLNDCQGCHNAIGWKLMNATIKFDHNEDSRYPLTGRHKKTKCLKCHTQRTKRGKLKQFGPIPIQGCDSCHKDPHPQGIFNGISCTECHVTSGFKQNSIFKHASTGWPLRGAHLKEECLSCHKWENWAPPSSECVSCHEDVHRGQFGKIPCTQCHQETSFKKLTFDHNLHSRFPLRGKHKRVRCNQCHNQGRYKPMDMECVACHQKDNPHGDTFGDSPCSDCHSPIDWKKTQFNHNRVGFPLEGKHIDQPCYRCHPNGTETEDDTQSECGFCHTKTIHRSQFDQDCKGCHKGVEGWKIPVFDHSVSTFKLDGQHANLECKSCHNNGHYKPILQECSNCHQNFHKGQIDQACDTCHSPIEWSLAVFNHQIQSTYPLEGKHKDVDCKQCHIKNQFVGLDRECQSCHDDIHKGTKGPECAQCHNLKGWESNQAINHDFGAFRLEGVHDRLPCEECHGADRQKSLSGTGPECSNCHRDPHFGSFGPLCQDCHTQEQFLPSTFLHNKTGFRLSGAHRFVECRACHPGRIFGGLPKDCSFCHTDTFQSTVGGTCDHPANCPNAINRCQECHTTTSFQNARPGSVCGDICKSIGVE